MSGLSLALAAAPFTLPCFCFPKPNHVRTNLKLCSKQTSQPGQKRRKQGDENGQCKNSSFILLVATRSNKNHRDVA